MVLPGPLMVYLGLKRSVEEMWIEEKMAKVVGVELGHW